MKYKPEIDGLRAIAVLSVFLFHLGLQSFSGGFVGVDVFFVISGFLITSIIYKDLNKSAFTFKKFYERRIRRIIPALYVTLILSIFFVYRFFVTMEFKEFGWSLISCLYFFSNLFFWRKAGYFDQESEMKPLLHTWSLSIEEQFYIFFPCLMIFAFKYLRKYIVHFFSTLAIISFVAGLYYVKHDQNSGFYFMHLRAWELLMGSLIALGAFPKIESRKVHQGLGLAGMGLIFYAVFALNGDSSFPGFNAFIPCLGTALIIYTATHESIKTWVGRLLSTSPMTGVGKISYSMYLWHWPAIVFTKYYLVTEIGWQVQLGIFVGATVMSILSWKFIEQPFREKEGLFKSNKFVFGLLLALTLAMTAYGYVSTQPDVFPKRLNPQVKKFAKGARDSNPERKKCHEKGLELLKKDQACILGEKKSTKPEFAMWGDSHADAWMPAFQDLAHKNGVYGYYMSSSACPPLLDVVRVNQKTSIPCGEFNDLVIQKIEREKIPVVILVSRWATVGARFKDESTEDYYKKDSDQKLAVFEHGLETIMKRLQKSGSKIWVVKKLPESLDYSIPSALARYTALKKPIDGLQIDIHEFEKTSAGFNSVLDRLYQKYPMTIIDPALKICSEETGKCIVQVNGESLYFDRHHISKTGAMYMAPVMQPFFDDVKKVVGVR